MYYTMTIIQRISRYKQTIHIFEETEISINKHDICRSNKQVVKQTLTSLSVPTYVPKTQYTCTHKMLYVQFSAQLRLGTYYLHNMSKTGKIQTEKFFLCVDLYGMHYNLKISFLYYFWACFA